MVITMKKTLVFFMVIILTIGACGCMKRDTKNDRMMSYINNKYDDNFTFERIYGGSAGSDVDKIIVSSEKYPGKEIRVICSESDGKEIFSDTYLNIKFEEETYNYLSNSLSEIFGLNIYLKYIPDDISSMKDASDDTTFSEYISNEDTYIYFSAAVCSEVTDENIVFDKIKNVFSDAVVCGDIYFISENVVLSGDNGKSNALEYIKQGKYKKSLFFIKKTIDEYSKVEWKNGI